MNLTVSLAQFRVTLGDPAENLRRGEVLIAEAARRGSDLICFPEMWTTGFRWETNARIAAEHEAVIDAIAALAAKYRIWIHGSTLAVWGPGKIANATVLFDSAGQRVGVYRKTHLFRPIHEEAHITPGDALTMVDTPWGRAGLAICYDIRFPEIFRTYALQGADFVLLPAAFPRIRASLWRTLAHARAIENQMFFIGINQVGEEDFGDEAPLIYGGTSLIIDPLGHTIVEAGDREEVLLTATIDTALTAATRAAGNILEERRTDLYELGPIRAGQRSIPKRPQTRALENLP